MEHVEKLVQLEFQEVKGQPVHAVHRASQVLMEHKGRKDHQDDRETQDQLGEQVELELLESPDHRDLREDEARLEMLEVMVQLEIQVLRENPANED